MSKYHALCVVFITFCCISSLKADGFQENIASSRYETNPSGNIIREALRQVFKIPEGDHTTSKLIAGRPLRFMMKMYKRISEGESPLPPQANTIRSAMPLEKDSAVVRRYERDNFLVYNLTTSRQERLLTSYLHLMGHRRSPNRDSRLLFYLDSANETPNNTRPVMVAFMDNLPMDIDITRLSRKALEETPNLVLRLEEEQLRRGKWVKSSSKRLLRRTPLLIAISADAQLLDLEAFGVGALSLNKEFRETFNSEGEREDLMARSLLRATENELDHKRESRNRRAIKNSFDMPDSDKKHSEAASKNISKSKPAKKFKKKYDSNLLPPLENRLSNEAATALRDGSPSPFDGSCKRHELFVDLKQLGWERFIVAPFEFSLNFCAGVCSSPLSQMQAWTNHAIMLSLLRASTFPGKIPEACCVPSKLDASSLIMLEDDGRIALRFFPNMIVKSCSCQ